MKIVRRFKKRVSLILLDFFLVPIVCLLGSFSSGPFHGNFVKTKRNVRLMGQIRYFNKQYNYILLATGLSRQNPTIKQNVLSYIDVLPQPN